MHAGQLVALLLIDHLESVNGTLLTFPWVV
jgi:hypothetical protein